MLSALPDHRRRLSEGLLVEAAILARVLGVRILTLHTTVVLAPADVSSSSSAPRHLPTRPSTPTSRALPARSGAAGRGLAAAVQNINEGAKLLAETDRID